MAKIHDKFVIELAEVIKGYGNDPDVDDPFRLSEFYRFYELPEIAVSENHFKTMIPLEVVEKNAQSGWIPVTERLPEDDRDVLVTDGTDCAVAYWRTDAQAWDDSMHGWCDLYGLEVVAWQPLPTPYRKVGQDG